MICKICQKDVEKKKHNQIYCKDCAYKENLEAMRRWNKKYTALINSTPVFLKCEKCGETFQKVKFKHYGRRICCEKCKPEIEKAFNVSRCKKYYKINYHKVRARDKVNWCVSIGKLPKAETRVCVDCGKPAEEYHHEDYSKPLDVEALCKKCHIRRKEKNENEL